MRAFRHTLDTPLGRYHHYICEGHIHHMAEKRRIEIVAEIKKYCTQQYQQIRIDKVMEEMKGV